MMRMFLRHMTITNLFFLTCRNFALFLILVTPELYSFSMIYLKNGVLSIIHGLTGCTNSKVVPKNKKLLHKGKYPCSLLYYV